MHAFEADSRNFRRLSANIAQNALDFVCANALALSDVAGSVTLYSANNDNAGEHSLFQFDPSMRGVTIPAVTLDEY